MECEPIVVASLIGNVNPCKKVFNMKSPETVAQDSVELVDGKVSKDKSTCLKHSNDSCTTKSKSKRIERFNYTRSASSPIMVVRNPAKQNSSSNDVNEHRNVENKMECEWKQKPRHVSFDECVHVLTKCSVIEMPLKNSTRENNMAASCCQCRKGILKHGIGVRMNTKVAFEREELLRTAILNHNLSEFAQVCQQWEVNFNTKLSNGLAPLHLASIEGCFRIVQFILKHGGRVDELDELGWTPLHYTALHGHVPCAVALLQAGANVNALTADYCTAIDLATQDEMLLLLGRVINGVPNKTNLDENKETYV